MRVNEIVVLKEVANDLNAGREFYALNGTSVGDYFWDSMISDIESLVVYAGVHERIRGLYRMPAKRFPYSIYYEIADDIAYVIAVLPMRRNPIWVTSKLKNRR
ncbi:MAG: type II toxin-antitoxin system RelE/ParE family toxin [Deltaproteobacteria bacterium]|jgi:hypothetical protein|nr:type II toxin-antitoxin system RelE/ParE family toxin [Deltaproteobacteria bacterium]